MTIALKEYPNSCILALKGNTVVGHTKKIGLGWKVTSKVGNVWKSQKFEGQMTCYKLAKTKSEAVSLLKALPA